MRSSAFLMVSGMLLGLTVTSTRCEAQRTSYGAYLGSSIATVEEEAGLAPDATAKRRIGVQAGLWMNKPINGRLSFQPELHYTQKGVRFVNNVEEFGELLDAEVRLSLSYLEVPLLLNVNLGGQGTSSVRPFLLAGPAFAYRTSCSLGFSAEAISFDSPCDGSDFGDETSSDLGVSSFDVGAMLGGGLGFQIGGREATIGVRYTQGLVSIFDGTESGKNNNLSVLFGIGF